MSMWDELNETLRDSTRRMLDRARQRAQDVGEVSMRHLERQDLLAERKEILAQLGQIVADRFILEDKKTVRADTPAIAPCIERVREIDLRLQELSASS